MICVNISIGLKAFGRWEASKVAWCEEMRSSTKCSGRASCQGEQLLRAITQQIKKGQLPFGPPPNIVITSHTTKILSRNQPIIRPLMKRGSGFLGCDDPKQNTFENLAKLKKLDVVGLAKVA